MKKNYIISYTVKSITGHVIKTGKMRCRNRSSKFEAQVKFEDHPKIVYPDFGKLVIHSCEEENPLHGMLGDIFGGKTPFGF